MKTTLPKLAAFQPEIKKYKNAICLITKNTAVILWSSGQLYIGEINWQESPEGIGLLIFPFCGFYAGNFKNGMAEDFGLLKWPNGDYIYSNFKKASLDGWTLKNKSSTKSLTFKFYSKGLKVKSQKFEFNTNEKIELTKFEKKFSELEKNLIQKFEKNKGFLIKRTTDFFYVGSSFVNNLGSIGFKITKDFQIEVGEFDSSDFSLKSGRVVDDQGDITINKNNEVFWYENKTKICFKIENESNLIEQKIPENSENNLKNLIFDLNFIFEDQNFQQKEDFLKENLILFHESTFPKESHRFMQFGNNFSRAILRTGFIAFLGVYLTPFSTLMYKSQKTRFTSFSKSKEENFGFATVSSPPVSFQEKNKDDLLAFLQGKDSNKKSQKVPTNDKKIVELLFKKIQNSKDNRRSEDCLQKQKDQRKKYPTQLSPATPPASSANSNKKVFYPINKFQDVSAFLQSSTEKAKNQDKFFQKKRDLQGIESPHLRATIVTEKYDLGNSEIPRQNYSANRENIQTGQIIELTLQQKTPIPKLEFMSPSSMTEHDKSYSIQQVHASNFLKKKDSLINDQFTKTEIHQNLSESESFAAENEESPRNCEFMTFYKVRKEKQQAEFRYVKPDEAFFANAGTSTNSLGFDSISGVILNKQ